MKIQDKTTKIIFNVLAIVCIIIFCFSLTPRTLQNDRGTNYKQWNRHERSLFLA